MRNGLTVLGLALLLFARPPGQTSAERERTHGNFIEAVKLPSEQQTGMTPYVVQLLAKSAVRTAADAQDAVQRHLVGSGRGLDATSGLTPTSLVLLGRDMPNFAASGELVWEVRQVHVLGALIRVFWISATTKAVREIWP